MKQSHASSSGTNSSNNDADAINTQPSMTLQVYKSIELADDHKNAIREEDVDQPDHDHTQPTANASESKNDTQQSRVATFYKQGNPHSVTSKRNAVIGSKRDVLHIDKLTIEGDSKIKFILFCVVGFAFTITLNIDTREFDFYESTSIIMGGIFAQWIICVLLAIYNSDSLCAIRIISTKIKGFGQTTFPTQLFMLENKPIESISEFAGVRGGTVHVSTLMMSVGISILFIIGLQNKKYDIYVSKKINYFYQLEFAKIMFFLLSILCALGFLFVGYFEMNNHSKIHKIVHYMAVLLIAVNYIYTTIYIQPNPLFKCYFLKSTFVFTKTNVENNIYNLTCCNKKQQEQI